MLESVPDQARWSSRPDFDALRAEWSADRRTVEAMLAHAVMERDPLAAEALCHLPLEDPQRHGFVQLLGACLLSSPIGFHLAAARALHVLTADKVWRDEVLRVLEGAGFWADRVEAARALVDFESTPSIIHALGVALGDPEYLVRRQAAESLLHFSGETADVTAHPELHRLIRGTAAADWSLAAAELEQRATVYVQFH